MATVTGLTAPRMLEIEANSVVEGTVDENGHLKLTTHGGEVIDAGKVRGDKGEPGGVGPAGPASPPNPEPIATTGLSVTSNTAYHTPAGQPMSTVVFTWTIPTLDLIGDIPAIDLYELWYRLPGSSESTLLTASETNTATVTDLQPGQEVRVKVRAHSFQGAWGAFSSEIVVVPAVPSSSVPQEPSNFLINSNVGTYRSDGRSEAVLGISWDPVIESLDYEALGVRTYEIWLTVDGATTPILQTAETEVTLTFPSGILANLKVKAMSNFGVWGDFSESDSVTTAFPAQNNSPASTPILTTSMGTVSSKWDGNLGSGPAGPEFQHLITEVAPAPTGPWTAIGIPAVSSGQTATIPSIPGANVSVRFRWRDKLGRLSSGISSVASIDVIGISQADMTVELSDAIEQLNTAVISVTTEYAVNASETVPPSSGWSTATPARTPGTFVWMRTTTNYADSTSSTSNPVLVTGNTGSSGGTGAAGKGISSTAVTYQVHSNGTTAPTGTWVASPPATTTGQFLWTRTITTYTDATTSTAYSVAAHGATGANGTNGATGAPGVGVSGTVVTYQVHTSGTVAPTGTWLSSPAATAPGQFLWTRTVTTYTDASNATAYSVAAHGATGATGSTGAAGKGISSTVVTYQVHTSGTVVPTGTWVASPPATTVGQFLWTRTTITYTDASTVPVYSVSAHGATGDTGSTGSTGSAGVDATTIIVGNDAVAIPTNTAGATTTTHVITIPFSGWVGNARAAATISVTGLPTGMTAGTNTAATSGADGSLLLNVANASTLGGVSFGEITLTVTCNGKAFTRKFSWTKAIQGATGTTGGTGSAGAAATSVDIGNEATVIPTNSAGATLAASTITIPFTGFVGSTRAAATVAVSGLPTGITVQTNTEGTSGAAGSLVLAVANASTLGGSVSGNITLTITCNALTFVQMFSWAKGTAGATGSTGGTGAAGKGVSSVTPYYLLTATGAAAPAAPTTNPPGGSWTITEPAYVSSTDLWRAEIFVFTDATFGWTSVSKVSAYTAATQAMTAANLADAAAHGMVKASQTDPGQSLGRIWLQLDGSGKTIGIKISDGSAWTSYTLVADQVLVPSSVGTISLANGAVTAAKLILGDFSNMAPDPLVEHGSAHWGGTKVGVTGATGALNAIVITGLGPATYPSAYSTDFLPVDPGQQFYFSAEAIAAGAAGTATVRLQFTDKNKANPTYIGSSAASTTWSTISGSATAPAGAAFVKMWVEYAGGTNGALAHFTNFTLRSKSASVLIEDGAVKAAKMDATEIWANEAWLNVLRAGVIEASMVTSSFGSELTLESNMAINTIITNQANTSIELDALSAELANSNADISGLSNDLGTVEGTAEAAKTAAEAAAALAAANQTQLAQTQTWFRVDAQGAHVGRSDSPFQTHILPNKFSITDNGLETSWWEAGRMVVPVMEATKQIVIARHQMEPFPSVSPTGTVIRSIS